MGIRLWMYETYLSCLMFRSGLMHLPAIHQGRIHEFALCILWGEVGSFWLEPLNPCLILQNTFRFQNCLLVCRYWRKVYAMASDWKSHTCTCYTSKTLLHHHAVPQDPCFLSNALALKHLYTAVHKLLWKLVQVQTVSKKTLSHANCLSIAHC